MRRSECKINLPFVRIFSEVRQLTALFGKKGFFFFLVIIGIVFQNLKADSIPQCTFYFRETLLSGFSPVFSLDQNWTGTDGKVIENPWFQPENRDFQLNCHFFLNLPDSLSPDLPTHLYIPPVTWTVEIRLDGKYLYLHEVPFGNLLLPLDSELILPGPHVLALSFKVSGSLARFYPTPFGGLLGVPQLVKPNPNACPPLLPDLSDPDSVLFYAPWSADAGYQPDPSRFVNDLYRIKANGIKEIAFVFPPPSVYLEIMAKKDLKLASESHPYKRIAFFNDYPVANLPSDVLFLPWTGSRGEVKNNFGVWVNMGSGKLVWRQDFNNFAVIFFLLSGLAGIVAIKILSPRLFEGMLEYLTKSRIYFDLVKNQKLVSDIELILLNLFNLAIQAGSFSLLFYFLKCTGQTDWLNILTENSLLHRLVSNYELSLYGVFILLFLFLVLIYALKYGFISMIGSVFRLQYFSKMMQGLVVYSSYPLNFLLLAPCGFFFFLDIGNVHFAVIGWVVILVLFFIMRIYAIWAGLEYLMGFRTSLKILYICALEIIPLLFLL